MDKIFKDEMISNLQQIIYLLIYSLFIILVIKIYFICTMGWNKSNVCLIGKTVLITGGNSGMGYQTALMLASRGAKIILADKDDLIQSKKKIIEETKNDKIITKYLDLANLDTIKSLAKEINEEEDRLDVLINNAGISGYFPGFTKDGLQFLMQVNYFGPFLLTHLLIPLLKKSAPSRIIFVSSIAAFFPSNFRVDYLNNDPKTLFEKNFHYVNSKLCNDIASIGFAKKLMNTGVTCNALNPGLVKTALLKTAIKVSGLSFFTPILNVLVLLFGKTSYEGAQTHAYLAMAEEVKNITGAFFSDCKQWGHPWVTRNKELCKAVWEESEKFVKLSSKDKI
ncbi:retinol dehydrogenase 12-like [Onthophagus taurus]|uniref:retinol dehydrogenase 12-like n=1 Tax=Onthophagus taurus TaxID=166361 RepID=UPI0039BEB3F2